MNLPHEESTPDKCKCSVVQNNFSNLTEAGSPEKVKMAKNCSKIAKNLKNIIFGK